MKLFAAVAVVGILVAGGLGLGAAPAAAARADGPPAQCGLWSDTTNHSHWGNCRSYNVDVLVRTYAGSNWTRCVPAYQTSDLGNGFNIRSVEEYTDGC